MAFGVAHLAGPAVNLFKEQSDYGQSGKGLDRPVSQNATQSLTGREVGRRAFIGV